MYEDFSERLFAHYVTGQWRVPFSVNAIAVRPMDGPVLGQIITAGPQDIARVRAGLRGCEGASRARFAAQVARQAGPLASALGALGARGHPVPASALLQMAQAIADSNGPATGGFGLIDADLRRDPAAFGQALGAALGQGAVYVPPPGDALFATCLAQLADQSDLPPGAFNMLHARVPETLAVLRAGA